ncbi:MAG: hypothetical protein RL385_948 [Pseudomonadota bacterium]|jgi:hypothetical protein
MSRVLRTTILALLDGDEAFFVELQRKGFLPQDEEALGEDHLELARVTHNLVCELDVNWEGAEIVLRMRAELIATRRQVAELLALLREESPKAAAASASAPARQRTPPA